MNWLYWDKAPFLLTILFGLLTWQAGELFDAVRSGRAVIYELSTKPPAEASTFRNAIALRMENPSRNQVAGPFSFTINCRAKGCLTGNARAIVEEPNFANVLIDAGSTRDRAMIRATLAPGAIAWLVAEVPPSQEDAALGVGAIFDANLDEAATGKSEAAPLRVIKGSSIEAQIVGGWLHFLYWGIIAVILAIVGWLVLSLDAWRIARSGKSPETVPALSGTFELSDNAAHAQLKALGESLAAQLAAISSKLDSLPKGDEDDIAAPAR